MNYFYRNKFWVRVVAFTLASIIIYTNLASEHVYANQKYDASAAAEMNDAPVLALDDPDETMKMQSTNSFGALLCDTLDQEVEDQIENQGYNVFSVEMDGMNAKVSYETLEDATLLIVICDEDATGIAASGQKEVLAEDTEAVVTIEADRLPEYYYIKAYLIRTETYQPLCTVYESSMYTRDMQELKNSTINDYDEDRVMNLDNDAESNFAVFSDSVIRIPYIAGKNDVILADDDNLTYVIENADQAFMDLKVDDIFSYEYGTDQILIVKIADIQIDETTITITGSDTGLSEVFDYVKIDTDDMEGRDEYVELIDEEDQNDPELNNDTITESSDELDNTQAVGTLDVPEAEKIVEDTEYTENTEIAEEIDVTEEITDDQTGIEETSIPEAQIENDDNLQPDSGLSVSGTYKAGFSFKKTIEKEFKAEDDEGEQSGKVSGSVEVKGEFEGKVYLSLTKQYVELKTNYSVKFALELEGKIKSKIALGKYDMQICPGIYMHLTPSFVLEADISLKFEATLSGSIGVKLEKGKMESLTTHPKWTADIKIEGKIFIGFSLEPEITVLSKIVSASLDATAGVEMNLTRSVVSTEDDKHHLCNDCYEGEVNAKISGTLKLTIDFKIIKKAQFKINIVEVSKKISDVHLSWTYGEFAFTKCPHYEYKVKVIVKDAATGNPLQDVKVKELGVIGNTDKDGFLTYYAANGKYNIIAEKEGYKSKNSKIKIDDEETTLTIYMQPKPTDVEDYIDGEGNVVISKLTFPDDVFRDYIIKFDDNKDGILSQDERSRVDCINISYKRAISSVKGIEFFPNLQFLYCEHDDIKEIDLSSNKELIEVQCWSNDLKKINLQGCYKIKELDCHDNQLIDLDLSCLQVLENLYCQSNPLTILDVTGCRKLKGLQCSSCPLTEGLYVSGCSCLEDASILYTDLEAFVLSDCESLINLQIHDNNKLKTISLLDCSSLKTINCQKCSLTRLDIKGCYSLENIECCYNYSSLVKLDLSDCKNLRKLCCAYCSLDNLNLNGCALLEDLDIRGTNLSAIDLSQFHYLYGIDVRNTRISEIDISNILGNNIGSIWISAGHEIKIIDTLNRDIEEYYNNSYSISVTKIEKPVLLNTQPIGENDLSDVQFTNCINPNERYNYYIMNNRYAESPFSVDNLIYITQVVSDENGNVNIDYEVPDGATAMLMGMHSIPMEYTDITASDLYYNNGSEIPVGVEVTYNGLLLKEDEDYELTGDISGTDLGTYTITVKGLGEYSGSVNVDYHVVDKPIFLATKLKLDYYDITLEIDETKQLTATITPDNTTDQEVIWTSSDPNIATVSDTGLVKAISAGTVTITCTASDESGISSSCIVTVPQPVYTIIYTLNGGSMPTGVTNPTEYTYDTATITLNNPVRSGYTFGGWYTDSGFASGTKVTNIPQGSSGDKTFYAKWTKTKYTITYNLNSGKNNSANPASYYVTTDTITLVAPTRTGYTFAGWYSDSSFKTKVTKIAKGSTGNKTLYAKWSPNRYTIKYNGNGSTSGFMTEKTGCKYGTSYTLAANAFKKTGYTFAGWNTKANGTGTVYANKASVKNLSATSGGSVTLYAQWKKTKYTITYKLNGGKNNGSNPASYYVTTGTITLAKPTRTGYTFAGWYSDSSFKTKVTKITKGSTGNKTLYAKWTANKYTIKYNGNGATSGTMKNQTGCKYGTSYTLSANAYKKTGYTFAGWNTKKDGSGTTYKNKASVKNLTSKNGGTVTLYAQWKKK